MDTFENVSCKVRDVKSNYLKRNASQCLSPPCVLFFLRNFDGHVLLFWPLGFGIIFTRKEAVIFYVTCE